MFYAIMVILDFIIIFWFRKRLFIILFFLLTGVLGILGIILFNSIFFGVYKPLFDTMLY